MSDSSEKGRRRTRVLATVAAVLLACVGATAVAVGIASQDPAPSSAPGGQAVDPPAGSGDPPGGSPAGSPTDRKSPETNDAGSDGSAQAPKPVVSELEYSRPVRIEIPGIGVDADLVDVGLTEDGEMEVPQVADKAAWFTPSPPPGIPGSTVISGHVTYNGPAVFLKLGDLRRGDRVQVKRADGVNTIFEVTKIGSFPKTEFPTEAVYAQPSRSELRLITCGGEYDEVNNRYLDNVIVWGKLVGAKKA